jgi:hypothetical protein
MPAVPTAKTKPKSISFSSLATLADRQAEAARGNWSDYPIEHARKLHIKSLQHRGNGTSLVTATSNV